MEPSKEADLKSKRTEAVFDKKMQLLTNAQEKMSEIREELTLEIEELKSTRQMFISEVKKEIEKQSHELVAKILPSLIKGFEEKSQASVKMSLDRLSRVTDITHEVVTQTKSIMAAHKREMTLRRIGIAVFFFLGSGLTAYGINYFYPRYVNYHFTSRMADSMLLGEATRNIVGELTPKQKELLLNQYENRIKTEFAR